MSVRHTGKGGIAQELLGAFTGLRFGVIAALLLYRVQPLSIYLLNGTVYGYSGVGKITRLVFV